MMDSVEEANKRVVKRFDDQERGKWQDFSRDYGMIRLRQFISLES